MQKTSESDDLKVLQAGRTLEEARKLVEQSFGNYVGSNVMLAAKEELSRIQNEIEMLTAEISDEAIDRKSRKMLSESAYKEIAYLQEELRVVSNPCSNFCLVNLESVIIYLVHEPIKNMVVMMVNITSYNLNTFVQKTDCLCINSGLHYSKMVLAY